jgi:transposase
MADWLEACEVKTVAMQSTGVYWIPLYEILEQRGFEVYWVNARHTKNLPGRKSDVQESQWLLKLHTHGLLNNSFQPTAEIRVVFLAGIVSRQSHQRRQSASERHAPRNQPCGDGVANGRHHIDQKPELPGRAISS